MLNSSCQEGFCVNLFPALHLNSMRTENIYCNFSFLLFFCYAHYYCVWLSEAVAHKCSLKGPLKNCKKSQQNNCQSLFFKIKLQLEACNFTKKEIWHRCFPVNFAKFLRILFFIDKLLVAASRFFVLSFYSCGKLWLLTVKIFFWFWIDL